MKEVLLVGLASLITSAAFLTILVFFMLTHPHGI